MKKSIINLCLLMLIVIIIGYLVYIWLDAYRIELSHASTLFLSVIIIVYLILPLRFFHRWRQTFSWSGYIKYLISDFGLICQLSYRLISEFIITFFLLITLRLFKPRSTKDNKPQKSKASR
ncbi:MAG: hypothetical protein ACO2ZM_04330 [Francisellaceae bacterium]